MSTGGIFTLIANNGKQDKLLMATQLLHKRVQSIMKLRKASNLANPFPTLADIQKSHVLFVAASFKPYVATTSEYQKLELEGTFKLGDSIRWNLPQFGDFFADMVLHVSFNLPTYTTGDGYNFRWCDFPGEKFIKKAEVSVNGNVLDSYTRESYVTYRNFHLNEDKKNAYFKCMGQQLPNKFKYYTPSREGWNSANEFISADMNHEIGGLVYDGPQVKRKGTVQPVPNIELYIPLMFWFNKSLSLALPSAAIPYGQRYITIDTAQPYELMGFVRDNDLLYKQSAYQGDASGCSFTKDEVTYVNDINGTPGDFLGLKTCSLYVNNLFVNPEVHEIYIKRIGFQLIRVHKYHTERIEKDNNSVLLNNLKFPVEYLYVGARTKDSKYTHKQEYELNGWDTFGYRTYTEQEMIHKNTDAFHSLTTMHPNLNGPPSVRIVKSGYGLEEKEYNNKGVEYNQQTYLVGNNFDSSLLGKGFVNYQLQDKTTTVYDSLKLSQGTEVPVGTFKGPIGPHGREYLNKTFSTYSEPNFSTIRFNNTQVATEADMSNVPGFKAGIEVVKSCGNYIVCGCPSYQNGEKFTRGAVTVFKKSGAGYNLVQILKVTQQRELNNGVVDNTAHNWEDFGADIAVCSKYVAVRQSKRRPVQTDRWTSHNWLVYQLGTGNNAPLFDLRDWMLNEDTNNAITWNSDSTNIWNDLTSATISANSFAFINDGRYFAVSHNRWGNGGNMDVVSESLVTVHSLSGSGPKLHKVIHSGSSETWDSTVSGYKQLILGVVGDTSSDMLGIVIPKANGIDDKTELELRYQMVTDKDNNKLLSLVNDSQTSGNIYSVSGNNAVTRNVLPVNGDTTVHNIYSNSRNILRRFDGSLHHGMFIYNLPSALSKTVTGTNGTGVCVDKKNGSNSNGIRMSSICLYSFAAQMELDKTSEYEYQFKNATGLLRWNDTRQNTPSRILEYLSPGDTSKCMLAVNDTGTSVALLYNKQVTDTSSETLQNGINGVYLALFKSQNDKSLFTQVSNPSTELNAKADKHLSLLANQMKIGTTMINGKADWNNISNMCFCGNDLLISCLDGNEKDGSARGELVYMTPVIARQNQGPEGVVKVIRNETLYKVFPNTNILPHAGNHLLNELSLANQTVVKSYSYVDKPIITKLNARSGQIQFFHKDTPLKYFNAYAPYQYKELVSTDNERLFFMKFCINPGQYQPSGHINLSRAREFYLDFDCHVRKDDSGNVYETELYVEASAINFLLISDGSAVLRYAT